VEILNDLGKTCRLIVSFFGKNNSIAAARMVIKRVRVIGDNYCLAAQWVARVIEEALKMS
jgi:hypothetical protein